MVAVLRHVTFTKALCLQLGMSLWEASSKQRTKASSRSYQAIVVAKNHCFVCMFSTGEAVGLPNVQWEEKQLKSNGFKSFQWLMNPFILEEMEKRLWGNALDSSFRFCNDWCNRNQCIFWTIGLFDGMSAFCRGVTEFCLRQNSKSGSGDTSICILNDG